MVSAQATGERRRRGPDGRTPRPVGLGRHGRALRRRGALPHRVLERPHSDRPVQAARVQNAAKYAGASSVTIGLNERDGTLELQIADDGAGFEVDGAARGAGLQNMTDRLEALGGTISVRSAPGKGTTVSGRVPTIAQAGPS